MSIEVPSLVDGPRVYRSPEAVRTYPDFEINGDSAGELTVPLDPIFGPAADLQDTRQEIARLCDTLAGGGDRPEDIYDQMVLLEAEEAVLAGKQRILQEKAEHPLFVTAMHTWIETGYKNARDTGKALTRVELVQQIMGELREEVDGCSNDDERTEAETLLRIAGYIHDEYLAKDGLHAVIKEMRRDTAHLQSPSFV